MSPTSGPEAWDARYAAAAAAADSVWSLQPNAEIARILAGVPAGSVVDLGCGEGRNSLWLASRGWRVTAVDYSAVGLEIGRRRAADAALEVTWVRADAATWEPPPGVDLVLLAYLQLPAEVLVPILRRAAAALAPGGRLVVVGHDRDNLERGVGGPQDADVLHTVADLEDGAAGLLLERSGQVLRTVPVADRPAIDTVLVARRPPSSDSPPA
jgi:SAM-dependent methyltransferase